MFGITRKNIHLSMTPVYLFLFILITNEFFLIHSYVVIHNGQDQNQLENLRHHAIQQLVAQYFPTSEDSSSDDNDSLKPILERRFCCMSPLSGRKRFIRDLSQKTSTNIK